MKIVVVPVLPGLSQPEYWVFRPESGWCRIDMWLAAQIVSMMDICPEDWEGHKVACVTLPSDDYLFSPGA